MDSMKTPIDAIGKTVVCPNCGNQQSRSGFDQRCDRCGYLFEPAASQREGIVGAPIPGKASPIDLAPPMTAGGIGGATDGSQVVHQVTSAVPGKPMPPIADDPAGPSTPAGQATDPPAPAPRRRAR